MYKKIVLIIGLLLLPLIGEGIAQFRTILLAQAINSPSTFPLILVFDAVIALLFALLLYWVIINSREIRIPPTFSWALIIFGVIIVCINLFPPLIKYLSDVAMYRTFGGALWFVIGLTKTISSKSLS